MDEVTSVLYTTVNAQSALAEGAATGQDKITKNRQYLTRFHLDTVALCFRAGPEDCFI